MKSPVVVLSHFSQIDRRVVYRYFVEGKSPSDIALELFPDYFEDGRKWKYARTRVWNDIWRYKKYLRGYRSAEVQFHVI